MQKKSYSEKLEHPRWQSKRLSILKRDKWECKKCGDTETQLHIHHLYYENNLSPWEYPSDSLLTLCKHCHREMGILKEDGVSVPIEQITIFKSDGWSNDQRIMFIQYSDTILMRIYNSIDGEFVTGFVFNGCSISEINKLIKRCLKKTPPFCSTQKIG